MTVGADKRPRDDAADAHPLHGKLIRDVAPLVQLLDWHNLFVGGDLKHAIGRGIDDGRTCLDVPCTERVDDGRSGRDDIAQRRAPNAALELGDELAWKAVRERRKRAIEHQAHELPVPRYRILSRRPLRHAAERGQRHGRGRHLRKSHDPREAESGQRRNLELNRSRDIAERVAALVAVDRGVG